MNLSGLFIANTVFLGIGLSADAFSVSVVNGLSEPGLHPLKALKIASVFAFFQALMPLLGWLMTHTMLEHFRVLQKLIPWISLGLLTYLGIRMILSSRHREEECLCGQAAAGWALFSQGIATSLDALSAGFAIAEYPFALALPCALIIAAVTFTVCTVGVLLGRTLGCRLAGKAETLGGAVLIAVGIEIFATGI